VIGDKKSGNANVKGDSREEDADSLARFLILNFCFIFLVRQNREE
jgi:hypothetical protein